MSHRRDRTAWIARRFAAQISLRDSGKPMCAAGAVTEGPMHEFVEIERMTRDRRLGTARLLRWAKWLPLE